MKFIRIWLLLIIGDLLLTNPAYANAIVFDSFPFPVISTLLLLYVFGLIFSKRYKVLSAQIVVPWIVIIVFAFIIDKPRFILQMWPAYIFLNFIFSLVLKDRIIFESNHKDRIWYGLWSLTILLGVGITQWIDPMYDALWKEYGYKSSGFFSYDFFVVITLLFMVWHTYKLRTKPFNDY